MLKQSEVTVSGSKVEDFEIHTLIPRLLCMHETWEWDLDLSVLVCEAESGSYLFLIELISNKYTLNYIRVSIAQSKELCTDA